MRVREYLAAFIRSEIFPIKDVRKSYVFSLRGDRHPTWEAECSSRTGSGATELYKAPLAGCGGRLLPVW